MRFIGAVTVTIVKGSKHHKVKVVEDRPFLRISLLASCVVVAVLAVYLSYERGYSIGMAKQDEVKKELSRLALELKESQSLVEDLEQQVANHSLGAEVDRKANEEIRQQVISLKEEIAALTEDNTFYRGLMAPTKNKRGLTFGEVELSQTGRPRTYNYKVVMKQLATSHNLLNGTLSCKIVGQSNGLDVEYSLNQLSSELNTDLIKLRFKYFQTIEGSLVLPEGFEPLGIELVAKSKGKSPVTVEKKIVWLAQEV